ncbi:unnamed protein product [Effrenium voratum]|nr:unnamed protein product [Effrenium voratum]
MGNQAFCGEKGKCGEQCTQLTISQSLDNPVEEPEPAGAVFSDTLEGLNAIDRNLLLFSASSNLAAVRWLLVLGANRRVTDQKGTTCLHASCRSGSCSIVEVLVLLEEDGGSCAQAVEEASERSKRGPEVRDEAGWTALHVAAFMGRQDVVSVLLRNGAHVHSRTTKGQLAVELCSDVATRRLLQKEMRETIALHPTDYRLGASLEMPDDRVFGGVATSDSLESIVNGLQVEGGAMPKSCLTSPSREIRFEPFFVPRAPLIPDEDLELEMVELCAYLGCQIFEGQPGRGLAFLVVSGCVRDYPIDLVGFMRTAKLSPLQVGTFLGEDFSLSKILRMEFLNSVCLVDTGIVSALRTGLAGLKVPQDLQKLHRLLGSLSEVWWRQQLRAARLGLKRKESPKDDSDKELPDNLAAAVEVCSSEEIRGPSLRQLLPSINSLHQLFFSTVMLHWNLHAPLPPSQKLSFEAWNALNRSGSKEDVPAWLLEPVYTAVAQAPLEELSLELDEPQHPPTSGRFASTLKVVAETQVEGWALVFGDGLPVLPGGLGKPNAANFVECMQMTGMISEATATARTARKDSPPESAVWLSMKGPFFFFAMEPEPLKPFAFLHLKSWVTELDPSRSCFSLRATNADAEAPPAKLQLIVLLPDGRFQAFHLKKLNFELSDPTLQLWTQALQALKDQQSAPCAVDVPV